ncbi:MAG: hypothetical protein OEY29_02890 [Gammaproteobacteria bacterium]|nr:hypothetical protein [Gammaproteobacteria bacterium]
MNSSVNSGAVWPSKQPLSKLDTEQLSKRTLPHFMQLLSEEKIPAEANLIEAHKNLYVPFCAWLAAQPKSVPQIIGINGSQGSGKSTLTKILSNILEHGFNKRVVSFSIDDLYKTKQSRQLLAREIHPLFATRGVPGTHDIDLGIAVIEHLLRKQNTELAIPVFDKSCDDRLPESEWTKFQGECDIVLFEGWCVGAACEADEALLTPVNTLEKEEDASATWRRHVNQQLRSRYADLFSLIDTLILLKIPDFNKVFEWRKLQEKKLKASISSDSKNNATMSDTEIDRFIMHYERITKHTLKEMPDRCDIVFELGDDHQIKHVITKDNK